MQVAFVVCLKKGTLSVSGESNHINERSFRNSPENQAVSQQLVFWCFTQRSKEITKIQACRDVTRCHLKGTV